MLTHRCAGERNCTDRVVFLIPRVHIDPVYTVEVSAGLEDQGCMVTVAPRRRLQG